MLSIRMNKKIIKSSGVTDTERILVDFCDRTFLKLWSYPNPIKDDTKELCDLLAVFDNHIFIFFDRESQIFSKNGNDPLITWKRWEKKVIDSQVNTAYGAERYIKSKRKIFLDKELTIPFPIAIDYDNIIIHKIIIAHGAKEACKNFSNDNIYGSLAVSYANNKTDIPMPFILNMDKANPVHVFDTHNLPIIFNELDTFYDFTSYITAKEKAIATYKVLTYCGEEDLLAHYFLNFDIKKNKHYIGTLDKEIDFLMIGEGEWKDFIELDNYKNKKLADKISYYWDELIQITSKNTLDGVIEGSTPLRGQSAIHEMAKEPRFHRRALSEQIMKAIQNFPESSAKIMRNLSFMPSFYKDKAYVFLQLKVDVINDYESNYRPKRQAMLEIACGSAKNKFKHLKKIIGIAIDAPKFSKRNSEDFILMDCTKWTEKEKKYYEEANVGFNFFKSGKTFQKTVTEFPTRKKKIEENKNKKIGRNDPCPCGSGKKYKKCCLNK